MRMVLLRAVPSASALAVLVACTTPHDLYRGDAGRDVGAAPRADAGFDASRGTGIDASLDTGDGGDAFAPDVFFPRDANVDASVADLGAACDRGTGNVFAVVGAPREYVSMATNWRASPGTLWTASVIPVPRQRITITAGDWRFVFAAPSTGPFIRGRTYNGAVEPAASGALQPGLSIEGEGRACTRVTGSFTLHEVEFDAFTDVRRFRASFEQSCGGSAPPLHGCIRYDGP